MADGSVGETILVMMKPQGIFVNVSGWNIVVCNINFMKLSSLTARNA